MFRMRRASAPNRLLGGLSPAPCGKQSRSERVLSLKGRAMSARRPGAVDPRGRYVPEAGGALAPMASGNAGARLVHSLTPRRASLMQEPVLVLNATYE